MGQAVLLGAFPAFFVVCLGFLFVSFVLWWFFVVVGFFSSLFSWLLLEFVFSVAGKEAPVAVTAQSTGGGPAVAVVWLVSVLGAWACLINRVWFENLPVDYRARSICCIMLTDNLCV